MLQEMTQRDVRTAVNLAYCGIRDLLEDGGEALYRTLHLASTSEHVPGKSPAVAAQVEPDPYRPTDVETLAKLYGLVAAAYWDAWLECHVSGAAAETAELPPPPGWCLPAGEL